MDKRIKRIADYYGEEPQLMQLIEEMAELTQAITKYLKNGTSETWDHVCEEMADTEIMLQQGMYLVKGDELIGEYCEAKLKRQLERIEGQRPVQMIEGTHNLSLKSNKRYCWRVPDGMRVMRNQLVMVSTCQGTERAAVLRVFTLPKSEAEKYKPVLEILQAEEVDQDD